jgi:hypothetical protein
MVSGLTLISNADSERYRSSLEWYGYSVDDFELGETPDPPAAQGTEPPRGRVTVTRKSTGVTRHYHVGARSWVDQLEEDLNRGVFRAR